MSYAWPQDTDFASWELDLLDRDCPFCGRMMYICDHRYRHFHTLEGPVELVCKLNHCPDPNCPDHATTKSPELEVTIALPKWAIGWDVLCWIGHRRFSRHWAISRIQSELWDRYRIKLSADSLARYIRHYQIMLAARQEDPEALRRQYESSDEIILSINGLQPEKGHETLYVVRELTRKRVWFAEALISATADEVRRLIAKAKELAGLGQAGGAVVVGPAGCLRDRGRGGVSRRAPPLLPEPLPPRRGRARVGGRQPRQGPDAQEGARPAADRTGRARAARCRGVADRGRRRCPGHDDGHRGSVGPACAGGRSGRCRGARLLRGRARHPQRCSGRAAGASRPADGRGLG
jgi:hypothetical protein